MIYIGEYNELTFIRKVAAGVYLGVNNTEAFMPNKWLPPDIKIGDSLEVFVFRDSENKLVATTAHPFATANTFAFLEVTQTNRNGAFLDWGLEKDLLVPFNEQAHQMEEGNSYIVYIYVDEQTNRLLASSKLSKFIEREDIQLKEGDIVDLLIYSQTQLGYNAIVNNRYSGLIYKNEVYESIRIGDKVKGYIKTIREDNKIDLSLQKSGFELVDDVKWKIMAILKKENGFLPLHDNSTPGEIKNKLQISKKAFKKAVGALYKERLITLTSKGIHLA